MDVVRSRVFKEVNKNGEMYEMVDLKVLPKFSELNAEVQKVVKNSSWWEQYGVDWFVTCMAFILVFVSLSLMKSDSPWILCLGIFIYGSCHHTFAVKCGHAATHDAVCQTKKLNRFWGYFFSDICGSFSSELGYDIHIKVHHPHTNIIGLGDSSTWKMPFLPAYFYMFVAPLLLPIVTVPVCFKDMWGKWSRLAKYTVFGSIGLMINFYLLMNISGFSFTGALLCTWAARAVLAIPYIHVNIFQHIGLSMYHQKSRPSSRLFQMSRGVLNLPRNPFLDWTFGHSIISCHIEHHLFPKLSDNMCLKIQPLVSKFLKENDLPYYEDTYSNRMSQFVKKYDELMVKAPPLTHFVGIQ